MQKKALVVIDLQNDITKNYKEIIDNVNRSIDWAVENDIHVVYIKHYNLSDGTRTFKPATRGSELVADMKVVSNNLFEKSKGNALTSEAFVDFIKKHEINEFYITGADAIACVKSTVFNMCKEKYNVTIRPSAYCSPYFCPLPLFKKSKDARSKNIGGSQSPCWALSDEWA